jgi:DNA-binding CsgD family transcriptional regulator
MFVRLRQGRWHDAETLLSSVDALAEGIEADWLAPQLTAAHGLLRVLHGEISAGTALVERSAEESLRYPSVTARALRVHALLCSAIARNDWVGLVRRLDDEEDPGYRRRFRPEEWSALRLLAAWHVGNWVEVRRRLAEWGASSDAAGDAYFCTFTAIVAGHEGRFADEHAALVRALQALDLDYDPLGRTWVRIVAGTGFSHHGATGGPDPVSGLAAYEEALTELQELGAGAYARLCENIIRTTSSELSSRQLSPASVLSEQQLRVAELVAEGYTSVEVGQILHLSNKTIDFHVGNIVRRLGLENRREIARALRG